MQAIQLPLALGSQPGADDPDAAFVRLRVDHDHDPAVDRADCDEAILPLGMIGVEDLEVIDPGLEEPPRLREGQTVLSLVAAVLRGVPLELDGARA
jgi:hypothetical protein